MRRIAIRSRISSWVSSRLASDCFDLEQHFSNARKELVCVYGWYLEEISVYMHMHMHYVYVYARCNWTLPTNFKRKEGNIWMFWDRGLMSVKVSLLNYRKNIHFWKNWFFKVTFKQKVDLFQGGQIKSIFFMVI